jgi:hypothetical protein
MNLPIEKKEEMKKGVLNFFKEAFCADGEVKFVEGNFKFKVESIIEINDSSRGTFYIAKVIKK